MSCNVMVFHASDLMLEDIGDSPCPTCGDHLVSHAHHVSSIVPRGQAFVVDPRGITKTNLLTGETWTLADELE